MASDIDETTFQDCCTKLEALKLTDVDSLNHLIDQFNSLNFPNLRVGTEVII